MFVLPSILIPLFSQLQGRLSIFEYSEITQGVFSRIGIVVSVSVVSCSAIVVVSCCAKAGRRWFQSKWNILSTMMVFGSQSAILRIIDRYIDDGDDAMNTLSILQTMTRSDEQMTDIVAQMGGIELAVKALKRFSEVHEGVACSGCGMVTNLCGHKKKQIDQKILDTGCIAVLVRAMQQWPQNELVQIYSCTALNYLATSSIEAIPIKIIDVGGLVALAEARTKHQHDSRIALPANQAIVELVQSRPKTLGAS
jgi:hypothetical protein